MEEYKPNSHKSKEEQNETGSDKKIERIVNGSVKPKKKNEIQKLADIFISEDVNNVKSYILMDILIPAIKKAISDIVTNGIDMILYGENDHKRNGSISSKISYRNYYDKSSNSKGRDNSRSKNSYSYDDIIFENRGEAEDVLLRMEELISVYGLASVADLYDLVGINGSYTDNKYGWTDIRNGSVLRTKGGYILKLPKVIPLN